MVAEMTMEDQVRDFWLGALHVIALSQFIGAHGTDFSVRALVVEWKDLATGEKLHWSQVGLELKSLQIAWPLLQEH